MARRLPRPVDYRATYVRTQEPELFPEIELDSETGAYVTLLREAPATPADIAEPILEVLVDGSPRTRVTGPPGPGEYRVQANIVQESDGQGGVISRTVWTPILEFSASDDGLTGTCDYYRGGTIYTRLFMERLREFQRPLVGASLEALTTAHPPVSDEWTRGGPVDLAVVGGVLYYSTGAAWVQLAGGSPQSAAAGLSVASAPVQALGLTGRGTAVSSLPGAQASATAQAPAVTIGAAPGGASGTMGPADAPVSAQDVGATGGAAASLPDATATAAAQDLTAVGNAGGGATNILPDPSFETLALTTGVLSQTQWKGTAGVSIVGTDGTVSPSAGTKMLKLAAGADGGAGCTILITRAQWDALTGTLSGKFRALSAGTDQVITINLSGYSAAKALVAGTSGASFDVKGNTGTGAATNGTQREAAWTNITAGWVEKTWPDAKTFLDERWALLSQVARDSIAYVAINLAVSTPYAGALTAYVDEVSLS